MVRTSHEVDKVEIENRIFKMDPTVLCHYLHLGYDDLSNIIQTLVTSNSPGIDSNKLVSNWADELSGNEDFLLHEFGVRIK